MLSLNQITKTFGQLTVVDNLNLDIQKGQFLSLLGPSGCGKTTALRMIAGFVPPTRGTIVMHGRELSSAGWAMPPEKRDMAMIFQSYALWPNMTVAENIAFGLKMRKVDASEIRRRVSDMLDVVHLNALADRLPNELSGGQQQRVALARALVVKPDLLLLDEPLSNLDANLREDMRREIRRLHDEFGTTSIYVTHDQAEAMASSDRIAVMEKGRIQQVDDPHTLFTRPNTRYVAEFIGRANILKGNIVDEHITFGDFGVCLSRLTNGSRPASQQSYSLRTQTLTLHTNELKSDQLIVVPGRVSDAEFLGEKWEYVFETLNGENQLRVSAPPSQSIQKSHPVWLSFDPADLVPLQD